MPVTVHIRPRRWFVKAFIAGLSALAFSSAFDARADLAAPGTATVYGAQVAAKPVQESKWVRQIGRPDTIDELARRMLIAIRAWSPYEVDLNLPTVQAFPLLELQQRLCGGRCTVRAAYVPGEVLFYDAKMRLLQNRYHQSILFHELVHHVQVANGSHSGHEECHRWGKREAEAYALQNRFLFVLGLSPSVLNPGKVCSPA